MAPSPSGGQTDSPDGPNFTGQWLGHVAGTNKGLVSCSLTERNHVVRGHVSLNDLVHGVTSADLEGRTDGLKLGARLTNVRSGAPVVPASGELSGELTRDGSRFIGEWRTDIGTGGTVILSRLSSQDALAVDTDDAQIAPSAAGIAAPGPTPVLPPAEIDFKNVPITPFVMSLEDLGDLKRIFLEAAEKVRSIEVANIRRQVTDPQEQQRRLAIIPAPHAEITAANGKFIVMADFRNLEPNIVPADVKTVVLSSFGRQPMPSHGVVIRLNNLNGRDPQNAEGSISVHGSDATWVAGTFANVQNFFGSRRSRRRWLHRASTGQLLTWFGTFPLALWILFRALPAIPTRFSEFPLLTFGLFMYAFVFCYQVFDKFLRYARWTLPLYEIQIQRHQQFQRHRALIAVVALGVISAFAWDVVKFFIGAR